MRQINRRGRGADVDRRQPAGIAMRKNIDAFARLFLARQRFDQRQAMTADRLLIATSASAISAAH